MLLEGHNASEFAELQALDSVYAWGFLQLKTCFKGKVSICYSVRNGLVICRVSWRELLYESTSIIFLYVEASRKGNFKVVEFGHLPGNSWRACIFCQMCTVGSCHLCSLQSLSLSWACLCPAASQPHAVSSVFSPRKELCWTSFCPRQLVLQARARMFLYTECVCRMNNPPHCCSSFLTLSVWWENYPG